MDSLNWASAAAGSTLVAADGTPCTDQAWLLDDGGSGEVPSDLFIKLPPQRSVILRYVGWLAVEDRATNPAIVAVSSGSTPHTMTQLLKAQAKRGAGMQIWFVPGGIPPSHAHLHFHIESTFGAQPATLSSLYLFENVPVVGAAEAHSHPTTPRLATPTPGVERVASERTLLRSRSDRSAGRVSPFASVLDGLSADIAKLKGLKPVGAISPVQPPQKEPKELRSEAVGTTAPSSPAGASAVPAVSTPPPAPPADVPPDVAAQIFSRLEALERSVAVLQEQQRTSIPGEAVDLLVQKIEERVLKTFSERVDASISRLTDDLSARREKKQKRDRSPRTKTTTTTTTTTLFAQPQANGARHVAPAALEYSQPSHAAHVSYAQSPAQSPRGAVPMAPTAEPLDMSRACYSSLSDAEFDLLQQHHLHHFRSVTGGEPRADASTAHADPHAGAGTPAAQLPVEFQYLPTQPPPSVSRHLVNTPTPATTTVYRYGR